MSVHQSRKLSIALDGTKYLPGIVGLNNIKVREAPVIKDHYCHYS